MMPQMIGIIGAKISIHAPREGSDVLYNHKGGNHHISIHAPREGSDGPSFKNFNIGRAFLSTLPARGATDKRHLLHLLPCRFLSTLPARGATCVTFFATSSKPFLSTLPARGATAGGQALEKNTGKFLSTLPARGAT